MPAFCGGNTGILACLRLGILPAAFNPLTNAHLEMARQAVRQYALDEVRFLLPRVFPHKPYTGASFEQRLEMLRVALAGQAPFSFGTTGAGLFLEIARECRRIYGPETRFYILCGRDAAERIVNWDYGDLPSFARQLQEFQMLVAPRGGPYAAPGEFAGRIHHLDLAPELEACSASAVREAIAGGQSWEHLVPPPVADIIRRHRLYC